MRRISSIVPIFLALSLSACQTTSGGNTPKKTENGKRILTASTCLTERIFQVKTFKEPFLYVANTNSKTLKIQFNKKNGDVSRDEQGDSHADGTIDIMLCPNGFYAGRIPAVRLAILGNKSTEDIRSNGGLDILQSAWIKGMNTRILAWPAAEAYGVNLYLKQTPPLSKSTGVNLSGMRIRTNSLNWLVVAALGAVPKSISPRKIKRALAAKVIDGFVFPNGNISRHGWDEYINVKLEPSFYRPSMLLTINNDTYKSLSIIQQKELSLTAAGYEKESASVWRARLSRDNNAMRAQGIRMMYLKGEYAKAFQSTVHNVQFRRLKSQYDIDQFDQIKSQIYQPYK